MLAVALLAPVGSAMMLFLRIDPVKHRLLSPNYHPSTRVMLSIIHFFQFAGKVNLPY
jgi:hypothetical protein